MWRSSVVACTLLACSYEPEPPTRFVGTIEGENTLIFVVRDPSQTNAYACDGTRSPALFEWFDVTSADQVSINSDTGAATIAIDFDTRTGTLTTGPSRDFAFVSVEPEFGLYRGSKTDGDDTYEVGIILLDDRVQNGAIGITSAGSPDTTAIVSPRIVPGQVSIRLLNDVSIGLENTLNAYAR